MGLAGLLPGFLIVILIYHVSADEWMELPYGDDSFNVKAEFNTNVTLSCNVSGVSSEYEFQYWIAPDMTIMKESYSSSFRTLDGMAGWQVSEDGWELDAFLIQEAHFGFYYCIRSRVSNTDDVIAIKLAINYQGPYWGDLWEKYETNTIVGLTASGSFLALVIIIMITWHFRYDTKEPEVDRKDDVISEKGSVAHSGGYQEFGGYTNQAFEPIKGVGFSPVSPVDAHCVTGDAMGTTGKTTTSAL